jgi:hypothetical protein
MGAVREHLLRWRSSTMYPHRLRRVALHSLPDWNDWKHSIHEMRGNNCIKGIIFRIPENTDFADLKSKSRHGFNPWRLFQLP